MKLIYVCKLVLRKDKERKDGTCPIHLQVTLNGKKFVKLSTGERGKKEDNQCYYKFFDETFCKSRLNGLAKSTRDKYFLLKRNLKEFRPQLRLCEIDLKFLHDFRNFLLYEKELGRGGRWNREKNFRATVKLAFDLGMIRLDPFKNFKLDKPESKKDALNRKELDRIVKLDLKESKRLEEIRDKFLFACYTGLRFGDVNQLKWSNIENGMINIVQEKTKSPVNVPLVKEAKKLIAKNVKKKRERETIFRVVSNQKTNYVLKDIAKLAKVEKNVTFHLARHTFGTILGKTENSYTIARFMGHKKISTSAIYVNTECEELKDKMKNINFGLN